MGRHREKVDEEAHSHSNKNSGKRKSRYSLSSSSENDSYCSSFDEDSISRKRRKETDRSQTFNEDAEASVGSTPRNSNSLNVTMNNSTQHERNDHANARWAYNNRGRCPGRGRDRPENRFRRNNPPIPQHCNGYQLLQWGGGPQPYQPYQPHPIPPAPINFGTPAPFGQQMEYGPPWPWGITAPNMLCNNQQNFLPSQPPTVTRRPKGPTRAAQNDYSQYFVDTGARPQNFIRNSDLSVVPDDYPQLKELMKLKDQLIAKRSFNPVYLKCDLRNIKLSRELFGTKFDAILIDPPMEEYVRRAPGVLNADDYWTWDEIKSLEIEAIADNPCFIFLWVGSGEGLEQGRLCFKKWGFKRIDDICWLKTNHESVGKPDLLNHDSDSIFKRSKEHCLVGIKGCIAADMRNEHLMHPNIDVDIIVSEEPPYGSTQKPDYLYNIIEHLVQGRRRVEFFGEDHNIRRGWLTIGNELSSSNFDLKSFVKNFEYVEGKVWEGGQGRVAPLDAAHLTGTTSRIEELRPKSPTRRKPFVEQNGSGS